MSSEIDDLTVQYEEDGLVTVKELDKKVLTKGAWSTIIYPTRTGTGRKRNTARINIPFAVTRNVMESITRNPSSIFPARIRRGLLSRRLRNG